MALAIEPNAILVRRARRAGRNVGAADLILENQSERSLAQDRIVTGTGASLRLRPDQTATLFYDQTSARWRVLAATAF